ncbi:hypothetical protein BGLT_05810 [Caballeronia glathei]|uniref:Uncharacterized protein n=1 Tax=Caballeronia glathei TaxID=60547 RepID=A0A069PCU6_9BURK|nr:hypothetical protein [Caballeronia glathei]KDR38523.1 hypothetical protein BG61_39500 [Caballeronia glathei]CDY76725.1 hypothetical protein BGLT_05810 [Caballeronia glathei]
MTVELPEIPPHWAFPSPPRAIVWLALFIAFMLTGAALTLMTWPKGEPTGSAWFWTRLLVFPALAWCVAFGLRLHYYDEETDRLRAEQEALEADRIQAVEFAREPLAVLGSAYLCAMGAYGVASSIANEKQSALKARVPRPHAEAVRHTALASIDDEAAGGRYRALFLALLGELDDVLNDLPQRIPFDVRLQVPADTDRETLLETWKRCWEQLGYPQTSASLLDVAQGLMATDEWLDIKGGPALEKLRLFVAVQLYEDPPENSAEAGVALLLGWAPLAERLQLRSVALLHRPVESAPAEFAESIPTALLWGGVSAEEIKGVWQAGLTGQDKPSLVRGATDLGLQVAGEAAHKGVHDIDLALGKPGAASGWLAVALATEHAWQSGEPQMIAAREHALSLAVVRPTAPANEMEMEQ